MTRPSTSSALTAQAACAIREVLENIRALSVDDMSELRRTAELLEQHADLIRDALHSFAEHASQLRF
jgi:hypothetical protein